MSASRRGVVGLGLALVLGIGWAGPERAGAVIPSDDGERSFDVRKPSATAASPAQRRLRRTLGRGAVVSQAPLTGGVRIVARPDGFLTRRSGERPREVALDYVRDHPRVFGLDANDLATLRPARGYRSGSGAAHLWWEQTFRGIPAFDQGLRANVAADGRLINIGGAPRPDLSAASTEPRLGPEQALRAAGRSLSASIAPGAAGPSVGPEHRTEFAGGDRASLVLFTSTRGVRLAWRLLVLSSTDGAWDAVVDAEDGELLWRQSLVFHVDANVFDHYPGAPAGGSQRRQSLDAWLPAGSTTLSSNNTHVYSDVNDNDVASLSEEIAPGFYTQAPQSSSGAVCPAVGCTWNHNTASSWMANRSQAGTQLFYYVNNFHDHLRSAPGIGFDAASGNFEGTDRIIAESNDGAGFFPSCSHFKPGEGAVPHANNANITVTPDGVADSTMQMYLWTSGCASEPIFDVNGSDDALIVYHEYTHGLSFRLVDGLNGAQSGAMGEGWSDWYAEDYLVAAGFQGDTSAAGELRPGTYENFPALRTQGFDCPVGSGPPACPGAGTAGPGGYTYGDFGKIFCVPICSSEVHHDGEIWVETLWDLRNALIFAHGGVDGVVRARALITDGMRLSPPSPSFLDMRNAILQADVNRGFGDSYLIWTTFARRGMGLNARTTGHNDIAPVEDFTAPPPPPPPPSADTTPAVISGFTMTNRRFAVGLDRTPRVAQRRRRPPDGTSFRFRLSEPARVVITLEKGRPGRKVGRRCRPATRRLRSRRRCTRYKVVGRLTRRNRKAGRNRIAFSGRIGVKPLRLGAHRATVSATDAAGNRSKARRKKFVVVRGR